MQNEAYEITIKSLLRVNEILRIALKHYTNEELLANEKENLNYCLEKIVEENLLKQPGCCNAKERLR